MIKKILKVFTTIFIFTNTSIVLAAGVDHYNIIASPSKVAIGEAIDLTIEALDKNDNIIKDYEGSILILSESDKKAEFPSLEDNSYTFKKSNEGVVKFENAVKFYRAGKNDIHIYDLDNSDDSIFGLVQVEVLDKKVEKNVKIEILTPTNGTTIGTKTITISGKSTKNHQIKIILNNKKETLTTTNKDGIFEKEIDGLEDGNNSIKTYILDADGEEIGSSKEIVIGYDSNIPIFNKLKVSPDENIQVNSKLLFEVYATKHLKEVSIILNESLNTLIEDKAGIYKGEILAPKKEGEYSIDIILKNELDRKLEKKNVKEIIVIPEMKSADDCPNGDKSGDLYDGKCEKKLVKDDCPNGDYTGNVFDGKCGEKPADYNAPIDLGIKNLKVVELKTKSVLTWDKLDDAVKYEIYKKNNEGKYELLGTTKKAMYEFSITGDKIKYEYFAVKAIGKKVFTDENNVEQKKEIKGDMSDAIKVKTGPQEIFLIILALILGFGIFFIQKRKNI